MIENADLIWLAQGFAERLADDDWDAALQWAQVAENVSRGGHAVLARYDGGCWFVGRDAEHCSMPAGPGGRFCVVHARDRRANKADA